MFQKLSARFINVAACAFVGASLFAAAPHAQAATQVVAKVDISEQRRIAWMAYDLGIKYVGHGWNTALGLAADLQMASAFPDADLVEFIGGSPYVDGILSKPFALDAEGWLTIPNRPGLGVAIDRDKLARYTPDASALFA